MITPTVITTITEGFKVDTPPLMTITGFNSGGEVTGALTFCEGPTLTNYDN